MRAEKKKLGSPRSLPRTPPFAEASDEVLRALESDGLDPELFKTFVESCERSSELAAVVNPSSSLPRAAGILRNRLFNVNSWLLQEEEYVS